MECSWRRKRVLVRRRKRIFVVDNDKVRRSLGIERGYTADVKE